VHVQAYRLSVIADAVDGWPHYRPMLEGVLAYVE